MATTAEASRSHIETCTETRDCATALRVTAADTHTHTEGEQGRCREVGVGGRLEGGHRKHGREHEDDVTMTTSNSD